MPRTLFELHPVTGYRYIPGLHVRVPHEGGGYVVRCNHAGYRCRHEPTPQKPPGIFRVLVFGGGFTAGNGVDEALRFTDLLERQLGGYVQVLNFGLPGSGADQQLLGYRQHGRDIEHDLLVLCPHVETILRNLEAHASVPSGDPEADPDSPSLLPKPRFSLEGDELVLHPPPTEAPAPALDAPPTPPSLVRGLLQRFTAEVDKKVPGFQAFTRRVRGVGYPEEYADPQHPAWRLQRAILRTFLAEARAPVVLAPIPTFEHVDGALVADPYLTRFGEVAVEGRCELVNLLPRFFDEPRSVREQCRFPHDPHPTALGHALLAEGLLPHLRRYLP
jgi:carbamoyltransferase